MNLISDRIKKFIVKNIVGKIYFSQDKKSYQLAFRQIGRKEKDYIFAEIAKYPEWKNATPDSLGRVYDEVTKTVALCYNTKRNSSQSLNIADLKEGYVVELQGEDGILGKAILRLMYIGKRQDVNVRFFVLSSSRLAIMPEDVLEVYDTSLWGVGHGVTFKVYREGKRIPSDRLVYRTFPLTCLLLETPSIVHEVIDARSDFSYGEYVASHTDDKTFKLSYLQPSMDLLLSHFADAGHIYADFDADGVEASIYLEDNARLPYPQDAINAFCAMNVASAINGFVSTEKRGKVRIDAETNEIKLVEKITTK